MGQWELGLKQLTSSATARRKIVSWPKCFNLLDRETSLTGLF